jgi:hypothetical protein
VELKDILSSYTEDINDQIMSLTPEARHELNMEAIDIRLELPDLLPEEHAIWDNSDMGGTIPSGSYRPVLYRAYLRFQDWAITRILYDKEHRNV